MNANKKRTWAVVALSAAVMAALPASSTAQSPAEVNLWTYYGDTGSGAACVKTAADDYNASQSTYEVKIRNLAFSDFNQQVATAIAGGTTPDLMIVDNPDNARFAASGALADLTSKVEEWGQADQFLPGPWNSTQWEGKTYGIPLGSNTVVLWINTDLATAAGLDPASPPKTWEEFAAWAKAMTNKDAGVYGTALLAKKDETGTFLFLPWILQNGGSIDKLDSPEAIEALAYWHNLVDQGWAPRSAVNDGFAEIYQQFTTGKAGMMIERDLERSFHRYGRARPPLDGRRASVYEAASFVAGRRELGGLRFREAAGRCLGLPQVRHRSGLRHQAHRLHGLHAESQGRPRAGCRAVRGRRDHAGVPQADGIRRSARSAPQLVRGIGRHPGRTPGSAERAEEP